MVVNWLNVAVFLFFSALVIALVFLQDAGPWPVVALLAAWIYANTRG